MGGLFLCHAGALVLGAIFTFAFVPETRNKSLTQLEQIFKKNRNSENKVWKKEAESLVFSLSRLVDNNLINYTTIKISILLRHISVHYFHLTNQKGPPHGHIIYCPLIVKYAPQAEFTTIDFTVLRILLQCFMLQFMPLIPHIANSVSEF